jgi:hypothetical protein
MDRFLDAFERRLDKYTDEEIDAMTARADAVIADLRRVEAPRAEGVGALAREIVETLLATVERYGTLTGRKGAKKIEFPNVVNLQTGEQGTQIFDLMVNHVAAALTERRSAIEGHEGERDG